jgi:hypothetical protein
MKQIEEKKKQLKEFMHSLNQMSAKFDELERKNQSNSKKARRKRKRK